MRKIVLTAASMLIAAAAGVAFAQDYRRPQYEPYRGGEDARECWNAGARQYERVRPGERQNDLDFRRCRELSTNEGRECWNPRARTFEAIRSGERQDDLDMNRCRSARYMERSSNRNECWNPRAGQFESVRPGERQDDLDFTRCR